MKRKPKFRVGQRVGDSKWGAAIIRKIKSKYVGQQGDWCYVTTSGGTFLENELRPLTKRERESR